MLSDSSDVVSVDILAKELVAAVAKLPSEACTSNLHMAVSRTKNGRLRKIMK